MKKKVYIIPGFMEKSNDKNYRKVVNLFRERGFEAMLVNISWKHKTMEDYVQEFLINYNPTEETYYFGFSFGAIIVFVSSTIVKPKKQILCSLSPYFKEGLNFIKDSWKKSVGKKRVENFKKLSFNDLVGKVCCETFLLAGTREGLEVERRVNAAHSKIRKNKLVWIEGAKHDISQEVYLEKIKDVISVL